MVITAPSPPGRWNPRALSRARTASRARRAPTRTTDAINEVGPSLEPGQRVDIGGTGPSWRGRRTTCRTGQEQREQQQQGPPPRRGFWSGVSARHAAPTPPAALRLRLAAARRRSSLRARAASSADGPSAPLLMRGRRRESSSSAPAPSCGALYAPPIRIPLPPVRRSAAAERGFRAVPGGRRAARRLLARASTRST